MKKPHAGGEKFKMNGYFTSGEYQSFMLVERYVRLVVDRAREEETFTGWRPNVTESQVLIAAVKVAASRLESAPLPASMSPAAWKMTKNLVLPVKADSHAVIPQNG